MVKKKSVKKEKINYEVPSFVLGIFSIVFGFLSPAVGLILGIVGLVQSKKQKTVMSKKAKRLNIIGISISVIIFAFLLIFSYGNFLPAY